MVKRNFFSQPFVNIEIETVTRSGTASITSSYNKTYNKTYNQ